MVRSSMPIPSPTRTRAGTSSDTANGLTYTSNLLNLPETDLWVFDDMLIGASKTGVTAFVPASS